MSRKRRNTSSAEPDSPLQGQDQSATYDWSDDSTGEVEQPAINPHAGQVGAFPGLKDDGGLFYGPALDGIDYLRMVRSEAKGIPGFLSATQIRDTNDREQNNTYAGFFGEDEAFVAVPTASKPSYYGLPKAQQLYYESVLTRFYILRARLRCTPPLDAIQALPQSTPISFPTSSKFARKTWEDFMSKHAANPVQIASMDSDSILELIKLVTRRMRSLIRTAIQENTSDRMSTWIWAVLARCPDRGELTSEEISDLRTCAKAADMVRKWLQDRTGHRSADLSIGVSDSDDDAGDEWDTPIGLVEEGEKDKASGQQFDSREQKIKHSGESGQISTDDNGKIQVILDTIITVVGETYGQRDLLELRKSWNRLGAGSRPAARRVCASVSE